MWLNLTQNSRWFSQGRAYLAGSDWLLDTLSRIALPVISILLSGGVTICAGTALFSLHYSLFYNFQPNNRSL